MTDPPEAAAALLHKPPLYCAHRLPAVLICCQDFVAGLTDLPEAARAELQQLTPWSYLGNAAQQAKDLQQHLAKAK